MDYKYLLDLCFHIQLHLDNLIKACKVISPKEFYNFELKQRKKKTEKYFKSQQFWLLAINW